MAMRTALEVERLFLSWLGGLGAVLVLTVLGIGSLQAMLLKGSHYWWWQQGFYPALAAGWGLVCWKRRSLLRLRVAIVAAIAISYGAGLIGELSLLIHMGDPLQRMQNVRHARGVLMAAALPAVRLVWLQGIALGLVSSWVFTRRQLPGEKERRCL